MGAVRGTAKGNCAVCAAFFGRLTGGIVSAISVRRWLTVAAIRGDPPARPFRGAAADAALGKCPPGADVLPRSAAFPGMRSNPS